ncbi:hypothetical protein [Pseudomonas aeruginosa]|uniref:hypothetical protein n=1 Tax=Pseudomonas aeruginosa TaxID=287 RepID=UPI00345AF888|nr:hypothetical protein [Pseudomonas aeruginosa]HBO7144031.1 hypothetical protein [Pseudomonas aeruginosa]
MHFNEYLRRTRDEELKSKLDDELYRRINHWSEVILNQVVKIGDSISEEEPYLLALNAHSIYLGAAKMAISGHRAAAFPLFRTAWESATYSLVIARRPGHATLWKNRNNDENSYKRNVRYFSRKVNEIFEETVKRECSSYSDLLISMNRGLIDYGAHPNPKGISFDSFRDANGRLHNYVAVHDYRGDSGGLLLAQIACLDVGLAVSIILHLASKPNTSESHPELDELFEPEMLANNMLTEKYSKTSFDPDKRYPRPYTEN